MRTKIGKLWVEKYRPQNINDVVFQDLNQKKKFESYIKEGEIPHLLFQGVQGSGKTTLSRVLVNELQIDPIDVLTINASKENSVDTMRDKISNFVQTYSISKFKIVQLEECDGLSHQAQGALRGIMEDYSSYVRFIGTCNYINKIIPALRSRFQEFFFKAPHIEDTKVLAGSILVNEGIDFEMETLEKYVAVCYPDIRKLINNLNQNCVAGKLVFESAVATGDYKFKLLDLLESGNLRETRKFVCDNVSRDEFEDVYRFFYENMRKIAKFKNEELHEFGIVLTANYLDKHSRSADPEITFAAYCIELNNLGN